MAEIGVSLSSEEHGPSTPVRFAQMAEEAGFRSALIFDHFHPWIDRQGESPLVSEDAVSAGIACGPGPERHAGAIRVHLEAVYVSRVGGDQAGFLDFHNKELKHRLDA